MTHLDLYALLGLPKDADSKEIKRAFRTLAKRHHPDHNPENPRAAEKFIEVATAFEILSDPARRALYDEFGAQSLQDDFDPALARWQATQAKPPPHVQQDSWSSAKGAAQGGSFRSIFERVWEQHSPFSKEADESLYHNVFVEHGEDLHQEVTVSFALAATGGLTSLVMPDGSTLTVRVPAGVRDGEELRVEGEGLAAEDPSGRSGDLWLTLRVRPDARFVREGLHLLLELPVTIPEAVLGARISVPTPHGDCVMTLPQGVQSGAKLRLKQMGIHRGQEKGDLMVTVSIKSPDFIDTEIRQHVAHLARGYTTSVRAHLQEPGASG